jgi:hypothetical protein
MNRLRIERTDRLPDVEWTAFPGGELEGTRPRVLCPDCRARLQQVAAGTAEAVAPTLCFQCYRSDLERTRRLREAGDLNTASEERFQTSLPFTPVNRARLTRLKAEREVARVASRRGAGMYVEKRRRAQIQARNQLGRILLGLKERQLAQARSIEHGAADERRTGGSVRRGSRQLTADLRLPESWLPFVAAGR